MASFCTSYFAQPKGQCQFGPKVRIALKILNPARIV